MAALRYTFLFDYVSEPTNATIAAQHKGGWSENWWIGGTTPDPANALLLMQRRRLLLPKSCRIVGYRQQVFQQPGDIFIAGGARTVLLGLAGNQANSPDVPQMSLLCNASAAAQTNTKRFAIRAIPDEFVAGGELVSSATFLNNLTAYFNAIKGRPWSFQGRTLTTQLDAVVKILAGVVTVVNVANYHVDDFVLLRGVKDVNGKPVSGKFSVGAIAGNNVTLRDLDPDIVAGNVGFMTRYIQQLIPVSTVEFGRIGVRKVGRPFEQYRGRRSKRR